MFTSAKRMSVKSQEHSHILLMFLQNWLDYPQAVCLLVKWLMGNTVQLAREHTRTYLLNMIIFIEIFKVFSYITPSQFLQIIIVQMILACNMLWDVLHSPLHTHINFLKTESVAQLRVVHAHQHPSTFFQAWLHLDLRDYLIMLELVTKYKKSVTLILLYYIIS